MKTTPLKRTFLTLVLTLVLFSAKAQNTYYWVHNDINTNVNEFSADQVNATNTAAGTVYWKHFSKVSGSTSTANLLPATVNVTSNDNIIVDNLSFPVYALTYNMVINTPGALICKNFDAHTFVGGTQKFRITISTNLQVYGNFKLCPSNNFIQLSGPSVEFVNNLNTNVDSVYLYGTSVSTSYRTINLSSINIKTNGKVIFCDTVNCTSGGTTIAIVANDAVGDSCQVHFLENIYYVGYISIRAGFCYIHKNVQKIGGDIRVGQDLAGANGSDPVTCNAKFVSHAPGYFSAPGVWNTGYWADPSMPNGQNIYNYWGLFATYRGIADLQNSWVNDMSIYFYGGRGTGLKGNAGTNFITNTNNYMRFTGRQYDYHNGINGYKLRGKYFFDQNPATNLYTAKPTFANDTIVDTLLVKTNLSSFYTGSVVVNIAPTAYVKFWPGFTYYIGYPGIPTDNYIGFPSTYAITNSGKFICGDTLGGCGGVGTKMQQLNLLMQPGGTQQFYGTQFYTTQIKCTPTDIPAQRVMHYSNADMGGNNGFIFNLQAGMQTSNGAVGASGLYNYGTAPYTTAPFTANKPRTLMWDNTVSGASYWSQALWYNTADGDSLYNDCPPTFIDSVIIKPGTALKIDGYRNQCKSFVALAGAQTTLGSRTSNVGDSLNTLEVYGSFILNQKINNNLRRNIIFRAWQAYPQIKTSGTNFWAGFGFWGLNTGHNNANTETNPGSWTFMDSLCLYNKYITFSPRPNSAPDCKKVNFAAWTYAVADAPNNFTYPYGGTEVYQFVLTAGSIYTNDQTLHLPSFRAINDATKQQRLYLGKSIINIYEGEEKYNSGYPAQAGNMGWLAQDNGGRFIIYPGTSHIKFHCKTFMQANITANSPTGNTITNNPATTIFGTKGLNYYDVSFLENDTTGSTYGAGGYNTAGFTRAGIYQSLNCNYHNITFWSTDGQNTGLPQMRTIRDTISKITFKYNAGTFNTGRMSAYNESATTAMAGNATLINSSIDSLIFETKANFISDGTYNIKKYFYMPGGSTNTLLPGARNVIYNTASVVLSKKPWADSTRAHIIGYFNPAETAPLAPTSYTFAPYGAKISTHSSCDKATIIRYGGFKNAGTGVAYPTPYYYSGTAPRDTFDISYVMVIDDSLTQNQVVDPSTQLSGNTLNWNTGSVTALRTLVFRGTVAAQGGSWFDNTKWAQITYPGGIKTISAIGQCPPVCGDTVMFDNLSFPASTYSCDLGSSNNAYCGTMVWQPGVTGILSGQGTTVLTICNSLYFNASMSNKFLGQIVFTANDTNKVTEYIQSGKIPFNNQMYFNARNPKKGKWTLLDSVYQVPIVAGISSAGLKINAGTLYTKGKNLNLLGGFDINSTQYRGAYFSTSRLILGSGNNSYAASGTGTAFNVEGDYNKLTLKADSTDIYCTSGGTGCYSNFYTLNASLSGGSQAYYPARGFKFNRVTITSSLSAGSSTAAVWLRADTINTFTLNGRPQWTSAYKSYIKKFIVNNTASTYAAIQIGNTSATTVPLSRFNRNRIDTVRITHTFAAAAAIYWDTLYVKDEFTINAGSSLNLAKGGLTWLSNHCVANIVGTAAQPITINSPPTAIGTTYNYPAPTGNRLQNEHYIRKDSGVVCTNYAQLYNVWAIGNGNGNNSCTGGASFGCSLDPVANASGYGVWMAPVMSPTLGVRTLSDTTLYSSETPVAATSGRARFLAGAFADVGSPNQTSTHNNAGWDVAPNPTFPPVSLALSQYSVCPGAVVTASLSLTGSTTGRDYPISITYSVNGVQSAYTYTSAASNPLTFTLAPTVTTIINWHDMSNLRCFNNVITLDSSKKIIINPVPVVSVSGSTVTCNGTPVTLSGSGASTYSWSTSATTASITVSPSSTTVYTVVGTNTLSCKSAPVTATLNVNALPSLASAATNVACYGGSTGSVTLTPSGGSGSGYNITPTSNTNLVAGTYTYNVKDNAGCTSATQSVAITQPAAALSATANATANTNCTVPNGQVIATPSGGTSAYTYLWSNGGTTQTINNLTGGTYSVTVTDNNLCTYTTQATVVNPAGPIITASTSNTVICNGQSITITPSGGTSYTITPSVGTATTSTGAIAFTPTATTNYNVYGMNAASCLSNTVSLNVNVNANPTLSVTGTNTICSGATTTLTASGATNYVWTSGPSTASYSVNPNTTTVYAVTGINTVTTCSSTAQYTVTVNATPTVNIAGTNTLCAGNTTTLTASGATAYNWSNPSVSNTTTVSVSAASTTVYAVTGTNTATGCVSTPVQYTVSINPLPTISITGNTSICSGSSTTLTASSAAASTFTWSANAASATTASVVITPTVTDTYTVTGTNTVTGCNASAIITVTVIPTPTVSISSISNQTICIGNSTTLTPGGASTYSLTSGASTLTTTTSFVLTPTVTTTYTLSGISGSCVSNSVTTTITVNTLPVVSIAGTNTICAGNTSTLTASGATVYNWSNPSVNNTSTVSVSPTSTTIYAVTGTNTATGCMSVPTQYTVTVNATPTVAVAGSSSICSGGTTTLTASGATGGYVWSTAAITNTISVSPNGTTIYTVTGTNTVGSCTASAQFTVNVNATPTVSVVGTNTICSGNNTTLTASGATTYNWSNPVSTNTTVSVNPSATTIYAVTGVVGTCTSVPTNYTVTVNATPTVSIAGTSTICSGNSTTLTVSGAATSYTWSTGANTNTISASPNTNTIYTVSGTSTYTNGVSCTSAASQLTVNVNATPTVSIVGTNTICSGNSTVLTASGATSYTWNTSVNTNTLNVSPVITTTYNVTGAVGSCISAATPYTVTVNATPTVSVAGTNTICSGNNTALTANGAATSYTWTGNVNTNTLTVNPISTTVYTVAGTSNYAGINCTSISAQYTVTVNSTPTVSVAGTNIICSGNTTTLTANGANNYTWNTGALTSTLTTSPVSTTIYTVTGMNTAGSCTATSTYTINVNTNPILAVSSSTDIKCLGDANGSATVTATAGTSPSYTVNWDNGVSNSLSDNTLAAGTHTATIRDGNGCVNTTTLNIAAPTSSLSVSPVATTTTACGLSTGSATVTASGGWNTAYTYSYTPSVGSTTNTVGNLAGGGYAVQVTDANGCVVNTSFSISNPNSPTITATSASPSICSGNSVVITPSGASTYTITGGSVLSPTVGTSFTANPTSTTVYNLSGTDAANCTGTGTISITVNATPTVAVSGTNIICAGVSTILTASGANSYTWISPSVTTNTITVSPTAQTVYTVTGTNTVGSCTATATYTVNVNSKPNLTLPSVSNVKCLGDANGSATVTTTNGATTYTYGIDAPASTTSNIFTNLAAGTHTAYVNDANGCKDTLSINIAAPTASLTATVATSTAGCGLANGSATVTANGGWGSYTYTPNNPQTSLAAGNYTATVTDANGCIINTPFAISNPATPTITAALSSSAICTGATTTITASGASTYTITDGTNTYNTSTTQVVNPNTATVYTVSGTDVNNCISNSIPLTLSVNSLPTVTLASSTDVICLGDANGVATFTASGGVGSYTYNLSSNTNTITVTPASFSPLAAGNYTATVADGNGCMNTTTVTIGVPTASLSISSIATVTTSCGAATGSAMVTATGGWSSYTYTPVNPQNNLAAGDYTATVTDANGCVATQTFAIVNPNAPTLTVTPQNAVVCAGASATITPSGATTYSLNGTAASAPFVVSPTISAVYTIEGTDASQCVSTPIQVTVTVNSVPTLSVTATSNIKCLGDANGTATITTTAGSSTTYTYSVDQVTTASTNTFGNLAAGTHTIGVNDGNSCVNTTTLNIAAPTTSLSIASITTATTDCGASTGSATVTATGGWNSYTYTPSNPQNNLAAGNYTATVTDANGCIASQTFVIGSPTAPTVSLTANSTSLCAGGSATITPGGATSYSLNGVAATAPMIVTPSVSTTYTVTGSNGSCVSAPVTFITTVNNNPTLSVTATSNIKCLGDANGSATVTTTAGSSTTYTYNVDGVVSASTSTFGNLVAGTHTVIVNDGNGCKDTTTLNIAAPTASLSIASIATNTTACGAATGSATVTATGGWNSYTYTPFNPQNNLAAGNYTATVTDANGCVATQTFVINSTGSPTVTIVVSSNTLCSGSSATITASGATTYSLNGTAISSPMIVTPSVTTTYTVTGSNGSTCASAPLTTSITVNAIPTVAVVSNDVTVCSGTTASLEVANPSTSSTYTWSNASGTLTTGASYAIHNIQMNQAGMYTVTVSGVGSCTNSAVANLTVNSCDVIIPQLVTPNGDGNNDVFEVKNISQFANNKVEIFNRWGNIVYSANEYKNDWKGTDDKGNGGILPAGTYFVIVDFGDGKTPTYHGYIQLQY